MNRDRASDAEQYQDGMRSARGLAVALLVTALMAIGIAAAVVAALR